jgi:hypothetical protein
MVLTFVTNPMHTTHLSRQQKSGACTQAKQGKSSAQLHKVTLKTALIETQQISLD